MDFIFAIPLVILEKNRFVGVREHMAHYHPAIRMESTIDVDCHGGSLRLLNNQHKVTKAKRQVLFVCLFFFYFLDAER